MSSSEDRESLDQREEPAAAPACELSAKQEPSPADILRIKQQMSMQCFEMMVHINAGKSQISCGISEAERELPECMSDLVEIKTLHLKNTWKLHSTQIRDAIKERLKEEADSSSDSMTALIDGYMSFYSLITELQKEIKTLQNEVSELQMNRLELKELIKEKVQLVEELQSSKKECPESGKHKAARDKGQANLEKYRKMATTSLGVLRGMLLACHINWMDDPELKGIALTMEELSFSD